MFWKMYWWNSHAIKLQTISYTVMLIWGEKLRAILRYFITYILQKRVLFVRRDAVPRGSVDLHPGPAGPWCLWRTWHDLRSGLRRCSVYQRTQKAGEGERLRGSRRGDILLWRVHGVSPRTRVVFAVVPYNIMNGRSATPCQTLSLINGPRQKD